MAPWTRTSIGSRTSGVLFDQELVQMNANDVSTVYTVYNMFGYHMKIDMVNIYIYECNWTLQGVTRINKLMVRAAIKQPLRV